ncbi:MAG: PAS domain-containing sensor histidine kinase [Sulfurospirillaceae bacterium]|nr:PAS domain-containing sensor histidine kinase [Sulfurospirillaceae bacterium]
MLGKVNFTKRYVLALCIIALLSALAYYNLNHLITSQSNDGKTINLSVRQGMLSQQIALYAIYYKTENLKNNIKLMEDSHQHLISFPMTEELKKIYFEAPYFLDDKVRKYLFHAKKFEDSRDGRSLTYVLQNSQPLLDELNKCASVYVANAEANTIKLKQVELLIFLLTLLTLVFEAIFIFRPANIKITKDTKEIVKQKDYSNAVIESSTNAIITLDADLKIQTFNKMAEKIFGYTKKEMINLALFQKIIPQEHERIQKEVVYSFAKRLVAEDASEAQEAEAINKKGQKFPIRIAFGVSKESEDVIIVASVQDISKDKLKDKIMIQQGKFAALGEMIAIIAHQWRQPLAQLNFNCMYIRKKLTDPELIEEANKNEEIVQFMSDTITNFENFYKKTENSIFNPTVSINQAINIVETFLKTNDIELIKDVDDGITIYGNANSLAQVVLSIVQNTIDIVRSSKIENPRIEISLQSTKTYTILTIKDNAGGIKVSPIEDIFKPFHSAKKRASTGIGLYMSKLLIENQFHGTIVAKNVDNGAQFTIQLPSCCQVL